MRLIYLAILGLLPGLSWAGTITYDINSYGGKHAIVILSGEIGANVTANLSSDGLSIRVTASGVGFEPGPKGVAGTLISEVQQVRRGASSDLVLNLSRASELSVTPSVNNIKLFIKARKQSAESSAPSSTATGANTRKTKPIPIQFIATRDLSSLSPNSPQLIAIALPENAQGLGLSSLSEELRLIAYAIDVSWSWLSGLPISKTNGGAQDCAAPQQPRQEVAELEDLVKDLTQELIELRKQKSTGTRP